MGSGCGKFRWRSKKFIRCAAKKSPRPKNCLRTVIQSGNWAKRCRGGLSPRKSELWVTGEIRELLGEPELPQDRAIDEHDLNEQAWLVTRCPKEVTTTAELRANVERTFQENAFEMFVAPEARSEPVVTIDLDKVINQGVQAVFERESFVRTDLLAGEIVRLAPGQASNSEIEAALKNRDEFVRKKVGDNEMITTRAIIAEEEAIVPGITSGM